MILCEDLFEKRLISVGGSIRFGSSRRIRSNMRIMDDVGTMVEFAVHTRTNFVDKFGSSSSLTSFGKS